MDNVSKIATKKIPAGKRTYFLDLKKSREGDNYLHITESKKIEDGKYERHEILVFEEYLKPLAEAVQDFLQHFPSHKKKMQETKDKFENAYKPWSIEEDERLIKLVKEGKKVKELSLLFMRNEGAISSRINKFKNEDSNVES